MTQFRLVFLLTLLAASLVMIGAYTRLTHAGLGCPDWPGCYGHMIMPIDGKNLEKLKAENPGVVIQSTRAWIEMTHRYIAGTVALSLLALFIVSLRKRFKKETFPLLIPAVLLAVVIFQALLGMWTVTLKLLPQVVMGHLMGGVSLVSLLWWLSLTLKKPQVIKANQSFKPWIVFGLVLIVFQMMLGGWVSSNYAGISCIGFPFCQGDWLHQLDFKNAFNLSINLDANYQGGVLDTYGRMTIQLTHRLMALIVAIYWLALGAFLLKKGQGMIRYVALVVLFLLVAQVSLGIINVLYMLPFSIALLHNGVGLFLLLSAITLFYFCRVGKFTHVYQ